LERSTAQGAKTTNSLIKLVRTDDPPFLIIQGDKDTEVPPSQGDEMIERMTRAGVPAGSILVAGADHCVRNQQIDDPGRIAWVQRLVAFFDEHLK
jgi:dipeptidyl aminopeptidase/acylaminoacyl peptidase